MTSKTDSHLLVSKIVWTPPQNFNVVHLYKEIPNLYQRLFYYKAH